MTGRVIEQTPSKASRLISTINKALTEYDKVEIPSNGQFGFKATIKAPEVMLENSNPDNDFKGIDMEFDIPFDDDAIANEAEIIVYNLSETTISKLKVNNAISVTAGYGKDTGVIFEGYISKVKTVREGVDKVTTIYALDDVKYTPQMMEEKTYSAGITASAILKDLLDRLELPIEVFKVQRDFTYDSETKVDGSIVENIKQYSEVCGVSTYIYKQRIYCRPIWDGDNLHFNVNANTGLIDSPEPFEEESTSEQYVDKVYGYNITMILQHRLSTAGIVKVDSVNYSGEYRVMSGTHSYDGLSATTEFKCMERVDTTIEETKTTTSTSEQSSDDKTDWETINTRRQAAARYAWLFAQDDRYGYTDAKYDVISGGNQIADSVEMNFNSINFIRFVWYYAGVNMYDKFVNGDNRGNDYLSWVLEKCDFERIEPFTLWKYGPLPTHLQTGDILFTPHNYDISGVTVAVIYLGDGDVVKCSLEGVTEGHEWAESGDQDGKEICVCKLNDLASEDAEVVQTWRAWRYMGTSLPKLS